MTIDRFLKLLDYRPKSQVLLKYNDTWVVEFRSMRGLRPSLLGGNRASKKDGQYFYFDITDWNNVGDGKFHSLDSDRRKVQILKFVKDDQEYRDLALVVNNQLRKLYKRNKP